MFDREKQMFPTVYMLWKAPDLLHAFTTQRPVMDVLLGGADLMIPGVITRGQVLLMSSMIIFIP